MKRAFFILITISPGTSVFIREKPNATAYVLGLGAPGPEMNRSQPDFCLEKGKQGSRSPPALEGLATGSMASADPPIHSNLILQALVFYTNALMENDGKLQQAACVALKHLRVSLTCPPP